MTEHDHDKEMFEEQHGVKAWMIVVFVAGAILLNGLLLLLVVGDKGPVFFTYGHEQDLPGESPATTYTYKTDYLHNTIFEPLYFLSVDWQRMKFQFFIRPYEQMMPKVPQGVIPVDGGEIQYRMAPMGSLQNPIAMTPQSVERGLKAYKWFCIQCHGTRFDGDGTVGQSFNPVPTDLRSPQVQNASDDYLFRHMSYGGDRAPALAYTVAVKDRWHIINAMRSLGIRTPGETSLSGDFRNELFQFNETK